MSEPYQKPNYLFFSILCFWYTLKPCHFDKIPTRLGKAGSYWV